MKTNSKRSSIIFSFIFKGPCNTYFNLLFTLQYHAVRPDLAAICGLGAVLQDFLGEYVADRGLMTLVACFVVFQERETSLCPKILVV